MADTAMIAVLASLLTGLLGIAVGSWFTTRRERWTLRCELYTRLLEHLGEAVDALELLYDAVLAGPGQGETAGNQWDIRIRQLTERESRAAEEIRRATSVATIMLSDEALKVLKSLQKGWNLSGQAESWGGTRVYSLRGSAKGIHRLGRSGEEGPSPLGPVGRNQTGGVEEGTVSIV